MERGEIKLNERFKQIRKDQKLTQAEFGKKLNLSRSAIANYDIGANILTERTISDVCRIFNVNEQWLRHGTGPMYRPEMDTDNLLAAQIGDLINSDDEFIKNFILEYLKLSDSGKEDVKNFIKNVSKFI
ncbi:MAG: helix-turn-helix transcriptional regulator [Lachnospiraceae bacterium]|nr:helix-turn-helix transcriptional regulator [Lachnospiraceae bacterium]